MSDLTPIGDIFAGMAARDAGVNAERAPLDPDRIGVRREPLPRSIRIAVLLRDRFTCRWCYRTSYPGDPLALEIDHVVPWSAGGSDHPVNLRVLCTECNQARSNRVEPALDRRQYPVGAACHLCTPAVRPDPAVNGFCLNCRQFGPIAYLANLLVGGAVPAAGIPAMQPRDVDYAPMTGLRAGAEAVLDTLRLRAVAQTVACEHCGARAGEPCTTPDGLPLTHTAAHSSRIEASS